MEFPGSELATAATRIGDSRAVVTRSKRKRRYLRPRIDRRNRTGRRIVELTKTFKASIGGRPLTPLLEIRIAEAAELLAIAEEARAAWLRGDGDRLEAVATMERHAAAAVKALPLVDASSRAEPSWIAELAKAAPK